jgi:hypothetical protein
VTLALSASGLLVPQGSLEAAVQSALKQHDPDLRLVPQDSDVYGQRVYKVFKWNGPDRPATFLMTWADEHLRPLPLSMNLVEMVKYHDRNTSLRPPDENELEAKLREERRKDYLRDAEAIVADHQDRVDGKSQQPLPRSRSLYLARQRHRRKLSPEMWS